MKMAFMNLRIWKLGYMSLMRLHLIELRMTYGFEVRLPQKYFNTEVSLALLPGFERDARSSFSKVLETFLALSTSVLLVFNHKKLAQLDQQLLIERVASDYKDSAPVFALSFAEELDVEQREELKRDLSQKFTIPSNETDRIVFTGISEDLRNSPGTNH